MALDVDAARRAIHERAAEPLGLGLEEPAYGIHQLANDDADDLPGRHPNVDVVQRDPAVGAIAKDHPSTKVAADLLMAKYFSPK
jgi:hypothetical protein